MAIRRRKAVTQQSIYAEVDAQDEIHLRRIYTDAQGPPVFMLHGSIENGKIFYTERGRGLGPYLARAGYDVFVGDLRGRGKSRPALNRHSYFGQTDAIIEDIPAMLKEIRRLKGRKHQYWIAHSWGGVLMASHLARFPAAAKMCRALVFFGSKRCIRVFNLEKLVKIDLFWNRFAPLLIAIYGYLPSKSLGIGMDNESAKSHLHCKKWVVPGPWIDPDDGFDYGKAIRKIDMPPTLHLAGAGDACLGHPDDCQDFMKEISGADDHFHLLGQMNGHRHDYGHIDMLTHLGAAQDVYPLALDWLQSSSRKKDRH